MFTHTEYKPYKCGTCGASFTQQRDLIRHMVIHNGNTVCGCGICGKVFKQNDTLTNHMLIHTDNKPHKCGICRASFAQKGDLTMHMFIHPGDIPYSSRDWGETLRLKDNSTRLQIRKTSMEGLKALLHRKVVKM